MGHYDEQREAEADHEAEALKERYDALQKKLPDYNPSYRHPVAEPAILAACVTVVRPEEFQAHDVTPVERRARWAKAVMTRYNAILMAHKRYVK